MIRTRARMFLPVLLLLACAEVAECVELADIFGPEMILQRDAPVPVWGRAEPGENITVKFAGQTKAGVADQHGRWSLLLDAMSASAEPRPLTVQVADEPVTLDNVRVGEVWLVLGLRVGPQYSAEGPVPRPNTRVRHFGAGRPNHSPIPMENYGGHRPWGPDRHTKFDVLSIPFANRLNKELGVPVGIVRVEVGHLDATTPRQGFAAVESLKDIAERVETWDPAAPRGRQAYAQWLSQMRQWKRTLDGKIASGEPIEPIQPPLVPGPVPGDPAEPTVVYNRQLHPLVPFAFRGVFHIHEESHQGDPRCTTDPRYPEKMRALIAGLRAVFGRTDLAFAFSQRNQPSIYHTHTLGGKETRKDGNDLAFNAWYGHRDRQRRVLPYENTGMVVTLDIENYAGQVGERFARWALAKVYDKEGATSGPVYKSHRVDGDRVVITFDHTDVGLMVASIPEIGRPPVEHENTPLRLFAVAGADLIFHRAEARIEGDTVVVRSDKVAQPVAVRYACHFDPRGMNLYNHAGLPASPFRTDDWPIGDFDETVERFTAQDADALVTMLGYPTMLHSHAAAKALASKGETTVVPLLERLIASDDPDQRCGALRTLGYLYWMGPVQRNYYGTKPQEVTPAIARAIGLIGEASKDTDPLIRRCAAEVLSLIGAEDEQTFQIIKRLAVDDDPLVRTAALRMSKYRFKSHAHNTGVAYALLEQKPFADRTSTYLAGNLLNHYRLLGPIDRNAVARFLLQVGPGRGGGVVGSLGDLLRRIKMPDGRPGLNDPQVLPALMHLYGIGYRNYMLYGVERWISYEDNVPVFRKKIERLQSEIKRLRREKSENWEDLSTRYADAIEGLENLTENSEKAKK